MAVEEVFLRVTPPVLCVQPVGEEAHKRREQQREEQDGEPGPELGARACTTRLQQLDGCALRAGVRDSGLDDAEEEHEDGEDLDGAVASPCEVPDGHGGDGTGAAEDDMQGDRDVVAEGFVVEDVDGDEEGGEEGPLE